jgi:hypothetical protein
MSKGNTNPQEGQTMQWPNEKRQTMSYNALHRKLKLKEHKLYKDTWEKSGVLEG